MTGWKTLVSGIGAIFTGLGLAITGILSDPMDVEKIAQGLFMASGGGAAIGIGHKVEKAGIKKVVIKASALKEALQK